MNQCLADLNEEVIEQSQSKSIIMMTVESPDNRSQCSEYNNRQSGSSNIKVSLLEHEITGIEPEPEELNAKGSTPTPSFLMEKNSTTSFGQVVK